MSAHLTGGGAGAPGDVVACAPMARVVVVTGGGTGIGRAAAHELAGDGDVVVILGRRQGVLDLALDDLRAEHAGTEFLARSVDVGDPAQVDGLAPWLRAAVGPTVDVIVNSAAVRSEAVPPELTAVEVAQRFDAVLRVNLVGTYLVIHALEPMLRRPGGRIVNVISAAAVFAGGNELYSASKGGVMSMSYPLSKRLGADGITVNCVAPGFILSERWHERGVHDVHRVSHFARWRAGDPHEEAERVAFREIRSRYDGAGTGPFGERAKVIVSARRASFARGLEHGARIHHLNQPGSQQSLCDPLGDHGPDRVERLVSGAILERRDDDARRDNHWCFHGHATPHRPRADGGHHDGRRPQRDESRKPFRRCGWRGRRRLAAHHRGLRRWHRTDVDVRRADAWNVVRRVGRCHGRCGAVHPGPNLVGQPNDVRVRGAIELLANECLVDGSMPNGTVAVTRCCQRPHEPDGDPRVDRIFRGQAAPPSDRRRVVASRLGASRARVEHRFAVVLQGASLVLHPPVELRGAREVESIQERPGVERRRTIVVTRGNGLLELRHVTR